MDTKHLRTTTEARLKRILDNDTNVSLATTNFCLNEQTFDSIMESIKIEKYSYYNNESSDTDDSASIVYNSINDENKKLQKVELCKLASTSYEKDVKVSESNSQELTDTRLVDSKIVSRHTNSSSTALPIMKMLSPKSGPHTCLESCFKCNKVFRVLDNPLHIYRIRSIDKQKEFLKIEPSLCGDSCLCFFCWKHLEKTYKSNKPKTRKEESFSEKKSRLLERHWKKNVSKNQKRARKCSLHLCSELNCYKMSVNKCENIKKIFSTFEFCRLVFVQSKKQTTDFLEFPFCLCKVHNSMILVMSACQICGEKLNAPFNSNDWSMYKMWNFVLIGNNLPLILKPGMFICVTCKGYISKRNPGFPTIDLPRLRENILKNNAIRVNIYGESQYNFFDIYEGSKYVALPIVFAKIEEEKECVPISKVKFSDLLTTNFEIAYTKNDTEAITRSVLLNLAEKNLYTSKLEPKDEGLYFEEDEEEYIETIEPNEPKDQSYNIYIDQIPNTSGIKMTNSLNKNVDDTSKNILSEKNPLANLTDNKVSKNIFNYFSYAATNHVVRHNDNEYWSQLHVDHQMKNYDDKISKNEEINQHLGITNDNLLQNVCKIDNVEIDENKSDINGFYQFVSLHNENENNQCKPNSLAGCSVTHDGCSMNIKEGNHCTNDINTIHETVCLNETDSSIYSSTAVEPSNVMINPVSKIRKLSDILCDRIFNKDVKKLRLNEKYSPYENNSQDDNTTKSYKNKYIAHPSINSPSILNMTSNSKNIYNSIILSDSEANSENILADYVMKEADYIIIASDDDLSLDSGCKLVNSELEIKPDHEIEMDCKFVSDSEKSLEGKIILDGENILDNYTTLLDSVNDSNCEMVPDSKTDSDSDEQPHINVFVTEDKFNNKKLSTLNIVSNVQKGSDDEILSDSGKVFETASCSEKGTIKHTIISDVEINPSGNKESTCIIISDNDKEFKNKVFSTYKINVQKGSDNKILLDGERVKIVSESEDIKTKYEIEPSGNKKSKCIIIYDNEKNFISKKLSTYKIVSNVKIISDCEMLLDDEEKVYDIESESENEKIKYIIVSKDENKYSGNKGSQCNIISSNEEKFNNEKSTFKILVKNVEKGSNSV